MSRRRRPLDTADVTARALDLAATERIIANRRRERIRTLRTALSDLVVMFQESHEEEIESNHHGDGPEGCTYCAALRVASAALRDTVGDA